MRDSTTTARDALIVDIGAGVVLDVPPEATVSERWADSHDWVTSSSGHLYAGPDVARALGLTQTALVKAVQAGTIEGVVYEIVGREIGQLYLTRVA